MVPETNSTFVGGRGPGRRAGVPQLLHLREEVQVGGGQHGQRGRSLRRCLPADHRVSIQDP